MVIMYVSIGLLLVFSKSDNIPQPVLIGLILILYGIMRGVNLYLKRETHTQSDEE
jgi:disulfide bond formation protein DsbB